MRKFLLLAALLLVICIPASAAEFTAPTAPPEVQSRMPEETASFGAGLHQLLRKAVSGIRPDIREAARTGLAAMSAVMLVSLLQSFSGPAKQLTDLAGAAAVAGILLSGSDSLIHLGADTVQRLSEYGKLLLPVMTAGMAAGGGVSASTALYTGTAIFDSLLSNLISHILVPMVYLFLALAAAGSALGEDVLKKMRDFVKWLMSWSLKTVLTVFTTYMSITGVVSGTTDAATLKAAKMTISSVVPVVGGILSDASESVLVSAGLMKNAAGIYGIFAILAVFLEPFLRIGIHYLILKLTAALSAIFGSKQMTELIGDFSTAMGLLLAMTGAACLLLLISTVCFMKGVG